MKSIHEASSFPQVRLKYLVNRIPGGTPDSRREEFWSDGTIPWISISDMSNRHSVGETAKKITPEARQKAGLEIGPAGTVLFAMYASVGEVAVTEIDAVWNQALIGLVPKSQRLSPSFLHYCLLAVRPYLPALYRSNTQNNLNAEQVENLRLPLPSRSQQEEIVAFLDRETAEIDAFIADQERLIGLLEERRVATITHAVTKGVDPNAPMKDSGLEWVGQIPEHWHMMPIKRIASIRGRIGFRGYTTADLVDEGSGAIALSPGNMRAGRLRWRNSTYISWEKYLESPEIVVSSGDTLLVKTGSTFGKTAYVELSENSHVTINPQIVILRPYNMDSYFFHCSVSNSRVHNEFRSYPTGGTTPTMTESRIGSIEIAVPDYKEQRAIADFLKRETAELDAAVSDAREAIALSRERRAALISAAVTGQVDISQHDRPVVETRVDEVRV